MSKVRIYNLGSLNLGVNPFQIADGDMIRSVNVQSPQVGAKKKRPGYITYLGTANGSAVDSLFNWTRNDGTTFWNYRASGGVLYYSSQGTGAWSICGNGTLTAGAHIGHAVLEDTLIIGDGTAATRHTTNGTSFTNTTNAPVAFDFVDFQNRIYAIGTASSMTYCNVGTPTDWTNDSASIIIPGPGRCHTIWKQNDRIVTGKNSGVMFRYDGRSLRDMATKLAPTSRQSIAEIEDFRFGLNRLGVFGYGGGMPELLSNPIEKQIYNDRGEGIQGTTFDNAPGVIHQYDYLLSVGTVTDDFTDEEVPDCILKYDFQLDEWGNYTFADRPTSWLSFKDENGNEQLIFGADNGQCYQLAGTANNDNGSSVASVMEFVVHGGIPETEKKWNYFWAFFNPGAQCRVQVALADTFTKGKKLWQHQASKVAKPVDGVVKFGFRETRKRLLFVKITEASRNTRFNFYGFTYDAEGIPTR